MATLHRGTPLGAVGKTKDTKLPLYRLDWREVDAGKKPLWTEVGPARQMVDVPLPPLTSPVWAAQLDGLMFAISPAYGEEILYLTRLAKEDQSRNRPFDTVVRERCMGLASKATQLAFYMLSDCIWDVDMEGTGYWMRGSEKLTYEVAMLIRFWDSQTGIGLVSGLAGAYRLHKLPEDEDDTADQMQCDLLKSFDKLVKERHRVIKKLEGKRGFSMGCTIDSPDPDMTKVREFVPPDQKAPLDGLEDPKVAMASEAFDDDDDGFTHPLA